MGDLRDGVSLWSLSDRRKYCMSHLGGAPAKKMTRDDMYCWAADFPCGKAHLARFIANRGNDDAEAAISPAFLKQNVEERLMPLFRDHPEVRFILFLPPFTPFAFAECRELIRARTAVMDRFLSLPNVELYDFQGVRDVCMNYDNYKDTTHYSAQISSWILEQIRLGRYRVTPENRRDFERQFSRMMDSFDEQKELAAMKKYYEENPPERKRKRGPAR